jgi:hypothetical protein
MAIIVLDLRPNFYEEVLVIDPLWMSGYLFGLLRIDIISLSEDPIFLEGFEMGKFDYERGYYP